MVNEPGTSGEWLPIFLRLAGERALVAGAGIEARRKIDRLLAHGAQVRLLTGPERPEPGLTARIRQGLVQHIDTLPESPGGYRLVIVAPGDENTRRAALAFARRHGLPVNAVDDPQNCTAILPAIVDRGPITIAVGSGGTAPELARMLRSRIERLVPESTGALARLAAELKDAIRSRFPELPRRRRFLNWLFGGAPADALRAGRSAQARELVAEALENSRFDTRGSVALVGAGPGDPELLTVKAMRLLQEADAIVHDALIDRRVLEYARRDAEIHDVGKRGGRCSTPQLKINSLMLELVADGKRVVRLKGGDPMVFGRGGEELEFLRAHDIEYSVVPGITAAAGCAAYAGIPLTHRDHAQSVHLVTAHGKRSIDRLDWASLARERQTLAFYMAVSRLDSVQQNLLRHGRDGATPVAIVENGARPEQRVLTGTLARLHDLAAEKNVTSPAMVYVGEVARLADQLCWWGDRPLAVDTASSVDSPFVGQKHVAHG